MASKQDLEARILAEYRVINKIKAPVRALMQHSGVVITTPEDQVAAEEVMMQQLLNADDKDVIGKCRINIAFYERKLAKMLEAEALRIEQEEVAVEAAARELGTAVKADALKRINGFTVSSTKSLNELLGLVYMAFDGPVPGVTDVLPKMCTGTAQSFRRVRVEYDKETGFNLVELIEPLSANKPRIVVKHKSLAQLGTLLKNN